MKRKKNKGNRLKFIISTLVLLFFSFAVITFIFNLLQFKDIENIIRYIVCIGLGLINILFIVLYYLYFFKKKYKIKIIVMTIIMVILSIALEFVNYNINKINLVLDNITDNYEEYKLALVTLVDNKATSISDINDSIGVIQDENIENGYKFAEEIVKKNKIKEELIKYETYLDIVADLYSGEIKYAFLPSNYDTMFSSNAEYKDIDKKIKILHEDSKKVEIVSVNKDVNKPFSILLMGVDTLGSSYNADTLLLVTFNPQTLSATMLSIPRDTYTTIACTGGKHKINSSGWYSDKCVVDTVSKLVDVDIDYYAKINFVGVVDLVDSLGGIDVDVVYPFCEQNSRREFGDNMIYVEEGLQHLNGEQALALTRNRKFLTGQCPSKYNEKGYYESNLRNDITRGLNQQLVLKGILNALSNIKDLDTVYSLFDTIGNNVSTNMDKNTIFSFYDIFKNIIVSSDLSNIESMFDIQKMSIEVYGTYVNISNLNLSMIVAHQNSINEISHAMKVNLGLADKKVIKEIKFDINMPYEEEIIGKGIYGGTTLEVLKDFVGKTEDDASLYCSQNNLNCFFEEVEITDGSYKNGEIISQSIPANYDISLIGKKKINFEVAKVEDPNKPFNYSICTKEENKDNSKCMIPDFTNKTVTELNTWYKKVGFIKFKLTAVNDSTKSNYIITKQSDIGKSIYEIVKDNTTIEITYVKNENNKEDSKPDSGNNTENNDNTTNKEENNNNNDNTGSEENKPVVPEPEPDKEETGNTEESNDEKEDNN